MQSTNKTINKIESLLFLFSTNKSPSAIRKMGKSTPYVIIKIDNETDNNALPDDRLILNCNYHLLGTTTNKYRESDIVNVNDLDLTGLEEDENGDIFLFDERTIPSASVFLMEKYCTKLGTLIKADARTIRGNRGSVQPGCIPAGA